MSIMDIMEDIKQNVDSMLVDRQARRVLVMHDLSRNEPSYERGCQGKADLGRSFVRQSERISRKRNKRYGVYRCPHCGGTHLTTKLEKRGQYPPLLHITTTPTKGNKHHE